MSDMIEIDGKLYNTEDAIIELDRVDCRESLAEFIKLSWHVIEPSQEYTHGWHIDMICEHLESITAGVELPNGTPYNRLLINIPPGTMKSLICNVFWPAWEWGPMGMPHMRYVCAAHKIENLSARDSRRMRMLVTSDWYQARWGDIVKLAKDQNEKLNFVNSATGFRIATAITSLTGIRGDRVIIDDPHSVDSAASETQRESEVNTFLEAVPSRLNNPMTSAIVVIMQRLHEEDISGVIIDKQLGYDHVMLPMEFDPLRARPTMLGTIDPREEDGELLFPDRFPPEVVLRDKKAMGAYASAGQFQQEPSPRGGGIIPREMWQLYEDPNGFMPEVDYVVASLDTAYGAKTHEGDFSAMTIWGVFSSDVGATVTNVVGPGGRMTVTRSYADNQTPKALLLYAYQKRAPLHELVTDVAKLCKQYKVDRILIEGKASGISVEQEIRRIYNHEPWALQIISPTVDKIARLYSVEALFSDGLVYAPDKGWADMVITQTTNFPKAKNDDLVDTVSMALRHLREIGVLARTDERNAALEAAKTHHGAAPKPLYPV